MKNSFWSFFFGVVLMHGLLLAATWNLVQNEEVRRVSILRLGTQTYTSAPRVSHSSPNKTSNAAPEQTPKAEPEVGAAGSPQGQAAGNSSTGQDKYNALDLYKSELQAKIDRNKYYPPMSRRLGQTGLVVVAFTLLEDGNIINVRIDTPSQFDRLNDSALEAVKKVEKFKPIPKEYGEAKMNIKLPVKFSII